MLCPELTLLGRTYVKKRKLRDFIPVFARIFEYEEFPHIFALSLFWNFTFLTWPAAEELAEMVDFGGTVIDKIYRVLVEYSDVPEMYNLVTSAELVEGNFRRIREFRVHEDFKKLLRNSMFSTHFFERQLWRLT